MTIIRFLVDTDLTSQNVHRMYVFPSWLMEPGCSWLERTVWLIVVVVIFMDGISRWSEIVIESMQTINNAWRQPTIIPSPISSYWYADVSRMAWAELGNCLLTQNSIKTCCECSFKNHICSLYQRILPKLCDNTFTVQTIHGFWWFHSSCAIPWYPADCFRWKIMNQYWQHTALCKGYIPYC